MAQLIVDSPTKEFPLMKGNGWRGTMSEFQADALGAFGRAFNNYGDAVRIHFFGPFYGYLFNHPDHWEHILKTNYKNYTKMPSPSFAVMQPLIGNGLVTNDGDSWLQQRRLAQPAFHRKRLLDMTTTMTTAISDFVTDLKSRELNQPLDMLEEMNKLTLRIAGETLFSIDLTGQAEEVGTAMLGAMEKTIDLTTQVTAAATLRIPFWPSTRELLADIHILDEVVESIIADRRATNEDKGDLLSMFMLAEDEETGERMDDKQLRDEVMTMMLAGHETSAVALTWAFYLLATHPEIYEQVKQEIDDVIADRTPTMGDVRELELLGRVISETLRLYPPAYATARYCNEEDIVDGYPVKAKTPVTLSQYFLHRHPDFWPNPETFDPGRFTPENSEGRHKFAYLPFSAGPRVCIGNNFALTEITLALAMILREWKPMVSADYTPELDPLITLRPKNRMPIRLVKSD